MSSAFNRVFCFLRAWGIIGRLCARADRREAPRWLWLGAAEVRTGINRLPVPGRSLAAGPHQPSTLHLVPRPPPPANLGAAEIHWAPPGGQRLPWCLKTQPALHEQLPSSVWSVVGAWGLGEASEKNTGQAGQAGSVLRGRGVLAQVTGRGAFWTVGTAWQRHEGVNTLQY